MPLEMRESRETCECALGHGGEAHIRGYECIFRGDCAAAMGAVCPIRGGEPPRRPRRAAKA